jgi:hypothetical protein
MSILEVSPRDYHRRLTLDRSDIFSPDSWLSKSRLWELKSSSLYRWRYHAKDFAPSAAMQWGTLIDAYITTPDEVDDIIVFNPYPDFRTKAAQELRDSATAQGKIVISGEEQLRALQAVAGVYADPVAGPVIRHSAKQVVLLNKIRGVNFKGLVDLVPTQSKCLYDFKTIGKLSVRGIESAITDYGYHVQAAVYLKLWNACNPDDQRDRFRFIWQSSEPPYEVAVTELPTADIEAGEEWAAYQIDRLKKATEQNEWPGIFGGKVAIVGRPAYAMHQDEAEMDGITTAPTN